MERFPSFVAEEEHPEPASPQHRWHALSSDASGACCASPSTAETPTLRRDTVPPGRISVLLVKTPRPEEDTHLERMALGARTPGTMLISARRAEMPPTTDLLTTRQYTKLLADLRQIIGEGKQEAERAAAQALLESYWSIGKRIAKEKLTTRANFHNAILADLSADLAIDLRTLQRTVTFYQTYKRPPRVEGLSWAHFRILMQLQDANERTFYEQLAAEDSLSATRLRTAIQGARYDSAQRQQKGKPIVLKRPTDPSYLYKAEVRDVIDADTLLLDIDLGFEVIRRQSIRLARIDAPPRDTAQGAAGRRYVGHVFYAFNNQGIESTFLKGRYLNQELIDKGHAKPV